MDYLIIKINDPGKDKFVIAIDAKKLGEPMGKRLLRNHTIKTGNV
jgi:hypothetical protein